MLQQRLQGYDVLDRWRNYHFQGAIQLTPTLFDQQKAVLVNLFAMKIQGPNRASSNLL